MQRTIPKCHKNNFWEQKEFLEITTVMTEAKGSEEDVKYKVRVAPPKVGQKDSDRD